MRRISIAMTVAALAGALGACANSPNGLTTSAVTPAAVEAKPIADRTAVRIDPACGPLAVRIDELRKDVAVQNLEKASAGKTKTVAVKRKSLAQQAELNKANFEFQSKCMGPGQRATTAQAAPVVATAAPAVAAAKPVVTAAAPKPSIGTVRKP